MKPILLLMITAFCLVSMKPCFGAQKVLQAWDFTQATDTLGWRSAETLKEFKAAGEALVGVAGSGKPKLESPIFEIQATPFQSVEIEMKTDGDGSTLVYYSNTTDPPYGGFRPERLTSFSVKGDGKFHKYTFFPFWQSEGKIIHIRIDPPGESFAIRCVRIVGGDEAKGSTDKSWDFRGGDKGWQPTGLEASVKQTSAGLQVSGTRDLILLSPLLDVLSDDCPWATVRISSKTANTALFRWAADNAAGLQNVPIRLIGDGRVHSYAIELSEIGSWSGNIRALALTPSESVDKNSITLESIALGSAPVGPAELQIAKFGLDTAIARRGEQVNLVTEIRNAGGTEAKAVHVVINTRGAVKGVVENVDPWTNKYESKWSSEHDVQVETSRDIKSIAPGEVVRVEHPIVANTEDIHIATCRVSADGVPEYKQEINFKVYPRIDKSSLSKLKYVPRPQPADTGEYLVGAYNFPGWRDYGAWSVLDNFPERRPILGYYHDGSPEVTDWQINWAVSHGINFFIYDWYWSAGGRSLEEGLHDGFLKSRYREKMKFCLLWANHNPAGTHSEKDMEDVTNYWIKNYFNRPNYLKVNGKNVVVIFAAGNMTSDLGKDGVKRSFDKMRKMCEDAGVGGLYMVACSGPGKDYVDTLNYEGYDALSGYNYPWAGDKGQMVAPYEWMVDGYRDVWNRMSELSGIPYIPMCEAGWDSRPWHGATARIRTGKTPALWEKMLRYAKAYEDNPKNKLAEGKKLVFLEAWNEYGEGDYIEPHAEYGFDYLEAIRKVFAPNSKQPEIVLPKDLGMGPYDLPKPEAKTAWEFSNKDDQNWYVGNMTNLSFDGGVMRAQAQGNDPAFYSPATEIDASKFKTLEIKMKMDANDTTQLFFARPRGSMSEERSVKFNALGDNEFHVYTVDMSRCKFWLGKIGSLRLDPNSSPGSKVEIAYIRLK